MLLPAWPMRVACQHMYDTVQAAATSTGTPELGTATRSSSSSGRGSSSSTGTSSGSGGSVDAQGTGGLSHQLPSLSELSRVQPSASALIQGLREAAAVLYNASGAVRCFSLATSGPAAGNSGPWGKQTRVWGVGREVGIGRGREMGA